MCKVLCCEVTMRIVSNVSKVCVHTVMMFGNTFWILLLLGCHDMATSVRILEFRVPNYEREGGTTLLGCQYDMRDDVLYSVKWYKDGNEFYRYAPKNDPPIKSFVWPGVYVDEARSSGTVVALTNLTYDSAGIYRCEVSGESPNFTTAHRESNISIYLLPESQPHVTGLQREYFIDDLVVSNCTSFASRPNVHLKWLVNDRPVPEEFVIGPWHRSSTARSNANDTTLQLRFRIAPADFINGAMRLMCQATIVPMYQTSTSSVHYVAIPFTMDSPSPVSTDNIDSTIKMEQSISTLLLAIFLLIFVI